MSIQWLLVHSALIFFSFFSIDVLSDSSVWKVSKGEDYFYVGGTIHLLTAKDHPLPPEFNEAYNDSGEIILETDLIAAQSMSFQSKLIAVMMYQDGRTLESELDPSTYQELNEFMDSRKIPLVNFQKFQPWGVSIMLTMLEYQRLGLLPEFGVDSHFNQRAISDNKIVSSLESPEEQLSFMRSMATIDPNLSIQHTLRDLTRLPEFIATIKDNWRNGDVESFIKNSLIVRMKKETPGIYNVLVTARNNAWMKQLPLLLNDNDIEFVLVGAMHLSGKEGLLDQLEESGFLVEQL